jgi:hypothetical protein
VLTTQPLSSAELKKEYSCNSTESGSFALLQGTFTFIGGLTFHGLTECTINLNRKASTHCRIAANIRNKFSEMTIWVGHQDRDFAGQMKFLVGKVNILIMLHNLGRLECGVLYTLPASSNKFGELVTSPAERMTASI